jgi:hypothetical protein
MSAMGDYLEDKILDHIFGKASYTAPGTVHIALFTADNGIETGDLTGELSGGGYSRVAVSASYWNTAAGGLIDNVNDIEFPTATADWGQITHGAVMDAATGGNVLFHGAFNIAKTIWTGDVFIIRAGDLRVTIN